MFGVGFWKILFLVAVVAAVWFGYRLLDRSGRRLSLQDRSRARRGESGPTVELERNPATGAYEPRREKGSR